MLYTDISVWLIALCALLGTIMIIWSGVHIRQKVVYQLRTQTNLIEALAQGDYSLRARAGQYEHELAPLFSAINRLAQRLSAQRWQSVESQQLVQTVLEHIDVAILAIDEQQHVQLYNPAAQKLFSLDSNNSFIKLPKELVPVNALSEGQNKVIELPMGLQSKRFNLHVEHYLSEGKTYKLVFVTDVHSLLRHEERNAWQRLIKVMSHEINNSLSPIASISQTLIKIINKQSDIALKSNITDNLEFIGKRASDLGQFIESYNQLARLPEPNCKPCSLQKLLSNCQQPFNNCEFNIILKSDVILHIDAVQIEQLLINLFKNAQDAAQQSERKCKIDIEWEFVGQQIRIRVCDNGAGIGNSDNLFVPFYSTKQHGSGIGLVLCQQIAEAHNGRLSLHNRPQQTGCCALLALPYNVE